MNDIKEGTVVFARMPVRETILKKIELNHQIRPYIIYMSTNDNCYGFAVTSNLSYENPSRICFPKKGSSPFYKNSAIYVNTIWRLDDSYIYNVVGSIGKDEYDYISRVVYSQKEQLNWLDDAIALYKKEYCCEPRHRAGDIVFNNDDQNFYFVYDINGKIYQVYRLENNEESYQNFLASEDCLDTYYQELFMLNDSYYFLNSDKRYVFENHGNFKYCASLNRELLKRNKTYIKAKKKIHSIESKK